MLFVKVVIPIIESKSQPCEMELTYDELEDWRNAIQFQMEANSQMLIELPDYLKNKPCYQDINKWQHRLLKFINSLIDNNLRVYRNVTAS